MLSIDGTPNPAVKDQVIPDIRCLKRYDSGANEGDCSSDLQNMYYIN